MRCVQYRDEYGNRHDYVDWGGGEKVIMSVTVTRRVRGDGREVDTYYILRDGTIIHPFTVGAERLCVYTSIRRLLKDIYTAIRYYDGDIEIQEFADSDNA